MSTESIAPTTNMTQDQSIRTMAITTALIYLQAQGLLRREEEGFSKQQVLDVADRFAGYIRDGRTES